MVVVNVDMLLTAGKAMVNAKIIFANANLDMNKVKDTCKDPHKAEFMGPGLGL